MDALERALAVELGGPLVRGVGEGGNGAVLSAFSAAKFAIRQNTADVNLLVIGDSTGNDTTEWVYLFGQWLATTYPTHSVSYRLWDDTSNVYATAVSLATGTGSNTIRIWNASVAGTRPSYFNGSKYATAVAALTTPDLVIWNHGKNLTSQGAAPTTRGDFLAPMEMVRQSFPTSAHAMILQSPNRDDSAMDYVVPIVTEICTDRGDTTPVDVYSAFMAQGKTASLYVDNLHPSASGSALWLSVIQQKWNASSPSAFTSLAAWLNAQTTNLLVNGNFSDWTGSVPASWTLGGAGTTAAKDTGEKFGAAAYSAAVSSTAAASSMSQSCASGVYTPLKGQAVTLAVRQKVPTGSAGSVGRIGISATGFSVTSVSAVNAQGGWRWLILAGASVPVSTAFLRIDLYADSSASAGSTCYYDRAILVAGDIPRDML